MKNKIFVSFLRGKERRLVAGFEACNSCLQFPSEAKKRNWVAGFEACNSCLQFPAEAKKRNCGCWTPRTRWRL